jgi:uncharacterized membrane protein
MMVLLCLSTNDAAAFRRGGARRQELPPSPKIPISRHAWAGHSNRVQQSTEMAPTVPPSNAPQGEEKPPRCAVSGAICPEDDLIPLRSIRPALFKMLQGRLPQISEDDSISEIELGKVRAEYVRSVLQEEVGQLSALEIKVAESLRERELLSQNIDKEFERKLTFGEALSDKIAEFGGSWRFIITFGVILTVWIIINILLTMRLGDKNTFDPYPFILLNLVLSCLAALQAPVIMMSQNRVESRDRLRSENDYVVNLKAELEIRHLHEKVDHVLNDVMQRLFEMQEIQIDLLNDLAASRERHLHPQEPPKPSA